jgi:hypothetical protein
MISASWLSLSAIGGTIVHLSAKCHSIEKRSSLSVVEAAASSRLPAPDLELLRSWRACRCFCMKAGLTGYPPRAAQANRHGFQGARRCPSETAHQDFDPQVGRGASASLSSDLIARSHFTAFTEGGPSTIRSEVKVSRITSGKCEATSATAQFTELPDRPLPEQPRTRQNAPGAFLGARPQCSGGTWCSSGCISAATTVNTRLESLCEGRPRLGPASLRFTHPRAPMRALDRAATR